MARLVLLAPFKSLSAMVDAAYPIASPLLAVRRRCKHCQSAHNAPSP